MAKKTTTRKPAAPKPKPRCGLVMPIASTPNCSESHWREVKEIFVSALKAKFATELVCEEPEVDIIQSKIVNNLYDNPLVVVDVSELNANVMFELGLRLAFDKPTILIKDDETAWKFDISPLETLVYPRDLRHSKIETFKKQLAGKAWASYEKGIKEGDSYSPYLKHFKKLERKTIPTEQVSDMELLLEKLNSIESSISRPRFSEIKLDTRTYVGTAKSANAFKNWVERAWKCEAFVRVEIAAARSDSNFLEVAILTKPKIQWVEAKTLSAQAMQFGMSRLVDTQSE